MNDKTNNMRANPLEIKSLATEYGFRLHDHQEAIGKMDFRKGGLIVEFYTTKCTVVVKGHPIEQQNKTHRGLGAGHFKGLLGYLDEVVKVEMPMAAKRPDLTRLEKAMDGLLLCNPNIDPKGTSKRIQEAINAFEEFQKQH